MHTAFCRLFSYLATTSFLLVYLSIMTDIVRTLRCTSRSICADFIVLSDNYRFSVSHFLPPFRFKLLCCFLQNFLEQLCLAPELLFNTYTQKKTYSILMTQEVRQYPKKTMQTEYVCIDRRTPSKSIFFSVLWRFPEFRSA